MWRKEIKKRRKRLYKIGGKGRVFNKKMRRR